jgi:hypothetical protein
MILLYLFDQYYVQYFSDAGGFQHHSGGDSEED